MIFRNPTNEQTYAAIPSVAAPIQYAQQSLISSATPQHHLAASQPTIQPTYEGKSAN